MPFNSPANDYMYAEDYTNNIGWFVTDRNQPEGKVCIYIFIPSDTRQVYDKTKTSEQEIIRAACINRIADTWGNGKDRLKALTRLHNAMKSKDKKKHLAEIISDTEKMRDQYISANNQQKLALKPEILRAEKESESLQKEVRELEKLIRNTEFKSIK